ncbi:SpoIIE family protein phosphatase [Streptomyces malaysiensis]|uniref:SpoIIE family protein phosphatase n=1 Tax=Streptomyces malaysiensis TaxID=92644 RepID=UPI00371D40CC
MATAVLDGKGTVLRWSRAAAELLGRTGGDVCGHRVWELLADVTGRPQENAQRQTVLQAVGQAQLRHQSGSTVDVIFHVLPLNGDEFLVLALPSRFTMDRDWDVSPLRGLFAQGRIAVCIHDTDLNIARANATLQTFGGLPLPPGSLRDIISTEEAEAAEAALRQVLDTGVPLIGRQQLMRWPLPPTRRRSMSLSAFQLEDTPGHPTGVATVFTDTSEQDRTRRQLDLQRAAAKRIGASLDVTRTAQDLTDVLVPAFGDLAWVLLADAVFDGNEPPKLAGGGQWHVRQTAVASATGAWPAPLLPPGTAAPPMPDSLIMRYVQRGKTVKGHRNENPLFHVPELSPLFVPEQGHSWVSSPLFARGLVLGVVVVWRTEQPEPFDEEDADLLTEIVSRAALSIDNARRYTREHRAVLALQQRLLPPATTDTPAAETAGLYVPAGGGAEISGDWYDVIPLPSLRVALVVGDVTGHGLHATATMGRLRTAVQTLADLELDPTELLTHLDDLVQQLAREEAPGSPVGATCLYAVYNPVTRRCGVASAGHPPPVVVRPDGTIEVIDVSPGPPLGVGGMPFETITVDLEPGSVLALYTDGLIKRDDDDIEDGMRRLTENLASPGHDRALGDIGRRLLADLGDAPPRDDIACLLVRTRAVPAENTASWQFPADPAAVADARAAAARQLAAWGLEELAFTTELVVSELVTNAVRYAGGPVELRLIRENVRL